MTIDVEVSFVPVHTFADRIGQPADRKNIGAAVKRKAVVETQAFLGHDLLIDRPQARIVGLKGMLGHVLFDDTAGWIQSHRERVGLQFSLQNFRTTKDTRFHEGMLWQRFFVSLSVLGG